MSFIFLAVAPLSLTKLLTYNVSVKCTQFRHSKRCSGWDKGRKTFVPPVYSSALGKKERKGEEEKKKKSK